MKLYKFIASTVIAGITAYLYKIAIPVLVLMCFMVLDYATGMVAAWVRNELNSKIGIIGIIKKVCYLVVICVAMGVDYLIYVGLAQAGIHINLSYFVGMIVTVWLMINEMISILENTAKISGKSAPPMLQKILGRLKNTVEEKSDCDE